MMPDNVSDLARRLAENAEAVCRHYLSNGRRAGGYWLAGDVQNSPGRSLYVRLRELTTGRGAGGKWTEYVAPRVMLRPRDLTLSQRRSTASTQRNVSAPWEAS